MAQWEARSALRYGSEHKGYFPSLPATKKFALQEIEVAGNVGKIRLIDRNHRIVYYDKYEELE